MSANCNTQKPAARSAAFAPHAARRIMAKIAWQYTPTQGSGLNMAQSALRGRHRHGFERRIPDQEM
jgi:hypothetical protein